MSNFSEIKFDFNKKFYSSSTLKAPQLIMHSFAGNYLSVFSDLTVDIFYKNLVIKLISEGKYPTLLISAEKNAENVLKDIETSCAIQKTLTKELFVIPQNLDVKAIEEIFKNNKELLNIPEDTVKNQKTIKTTEELKEEVVIDTSISKKSSFWTNVTNVINKVTSKKAAILDTVEKFEVEKEEQTPGLTDEESDMLFSDEVIIPPTAEVHMPKDIIEENNKIEAQEEIIEENNEIEAQEEIIEENNEIEAQEEIIEENNEIEAQEEIIEEEELVNLEEDLKKNNFLSSIKKLFKKSSIKKTAEEEDLISDEILVDEEIKDDVTLEAELAQEVQQALDDLETVTEETEEISSDIKTTTEEDVADVIEETTEDIADAIEELDEEIEKETEAEENNNSDNDDNNIENVELENKINFKKQLRNFLNKYSFFNKKVKIKKDDEIEWSNLNKEETPELEQEVVEESDSKEENE